MAAEWFVQADGESLGPLAPPDLRRLVQEGRVGPETLVRLGADGKWVPAGRVRGLLPEADSAATVTPARETAAARTPRATNSAPIESPSRREEPPAQGSASVPTRKRLGRDPSEFQAPPATTAPTKTAAPSAEVRPQRPAPSPNAMAGLPAAPQPAPLLNALGLASVACGGLALLMAWSTTAVVSLTALGILIASGAIVWAVVRRRAGLGMPVTGVLLCVAVLGSVFAYQAIVGDRFSTRLKLESTTRRDTGNVALSEAESDWVKFDNDVQWTRSDRPAIIGGIEVRVSSVTFDRAKLNDLGTEQDSKDPYVIVRIGIRNVERDRRVEYRSWSGSGALTDAGLAELTDRAGKKYPREDFGLGLQVAGQVTTATVNPTETVEDTLIFKATGKESDVYRLELPGSAVGEDGAFRFAIPADTINRIVE